MHWIFTFCLFVASLLWVSLEVRVKLSDYFWKPNSRFSKFCVNCLLRFYFVYCNNCGLNDIKGPCWCDCSLVTLRVPVICLWPAKTRKTLELFDIHTIHWLGAQIWFGPIWKKLATAPLSFRCIDGYSCLRFRNDIFFGCFSDFDWTCLVLHFDGNVCNWIPKVIRQQLVIFGVFSRIMLRFVDFISSWTEICMNYSIVILSWRNYLFFDG